MAIGTTANSYEILSKIAEGGMAELFLARVANATGLRHVVLKRISKERAQDTNYVRMFLDEAKLAAQLSHPNIAQVFDIGRLGASYFFTMEYVHGVTVHALVAAVAERKQRVPVGAVLAILSGAAAALAHAHEKTGPDGTPLGIIHRDVSPSNLMVSYDGHVKLVDFGIAKASTQSRQETQAGEIKGKVGYMSPEQTRLMRLDHRSDLYSLGICAWEMLTAKRLWKRESLFATLAAIATEAAPPPSIYRDALAPEIDALVGKLLATEVQDRFQTAREVVDAIEQVARTTRNNLTPTLLARLLRDLFGSPPEPWLSATEPDVVSVLTTPVPDAFGATFDADEASVSNVEAKLSDRFPTVTGEAEISTTSVRALPPPPSGPTAWDPSSSDADLQTRQVAALANAPVPSVPTSPPGAPTAVMDSAEPLDFAQTMEAQPRQPRPRTSSQLPPPNRARSPSAAPPVAPPIGVPPTIIGEPGSERAKRPSQAPQRQQWDPPSQRVKSPSGAPPIGVPPTMIGEPERAKRPSVAPSGPQQWEPPSQRAKPPSVVPATVIGIPGSGPQSTLPLSGARPAINVVPPTVVGELPQIAATVPDPGPRPAELPRESKPPVPRWPPPPHGDARLLKWWIVGGAAVGALATVIILLATNNDSTTDAPSDAVVVVAKPIDAAVAPGASDAAEAVVDAAPVAVDAAEPRVDAAANAPKPTKSKDELNTYFRARRYKDIIAECRLNGAQDDFAQVCTLAACRVREDVAQEWYRNVAPAKRPYTISDCKKSGRAIEDVCATDGLCRQ